MQSTYLFVSAAVCSLAYAMAYWKRWRQNRAEALAEAMYTSSSSESEVNVDVVEGIMVDSGKATVDLSSETECFEPPEYFSSSSRHDETCSVETVGAAEQPVKPLDKQLSSWASHHRVTRSALGDLLVILRNAGMQLPKDARTILKTPISVLTMEKCGEEYKYIGLVKGIQGTLDKVGNIQEDTLYLDVNVDNCKKLSLR